MSIISISKGPINAPSKFHKAIGDSLANKGMPNKTLGQSTSSSSSTPKASSSP